MIPSINDVAADLNKGINDVKKNVQGAADAVAPGLDKAGKGAATTLAGLWESGTALAGYGRETARGAADAVGDILATTPGGQLGKAAAGLFSEVLAEKQKQVSTLRDLLVGKSPILSKLDVFDVISARRNQLIEQVPAQNVKGFIDRIRDLIKNGNFADLSPANPGTPAPSNGSSLFAQLREIIAALLERLKQAEAQPGVPGGTTQPAPSAPILNPPVRPGDFLPLPKFPPAPGASTGDFKKDMLNQIKGIDGQIDSIKDALASGKVPPEDMLTLQLELQELLELKKQLVEMLTSISKSEHEMNMSVIRNLSL